MSGIQHQSMNGAGMNLVRIDEILRDCLVGVEEDAHKGVEFVDCHVKVAVVIDRARAHRGEILDVVKEWMQEAPHRSINGQNFITAGAVLGSQHRAIALFAVGKVLGLWDVVTPKDEGYGDDEAVQLVREGHIIITNLQDLELN